MRFDICCAHQKTNKKKTFKRRVCLRLGFALHFVVMLCVCQSNFIALRIFWHAHRISESFLKFQYCFSHQRRHLPTFGVGHTQSASNISLAVATLPGTTATLPPNVKIAMHSIRFTANRIFFLCVRLFFFVSFRLQSSNQPQTNLEQMSQNSYASGGGGASGGVTSDYQHQSHRQAAPAAAYQSQTADYGSSSTSSMSYATPSPSQYSFASSSPSTVPVPSPDVRQQPMDEAAVTFFTFFTSPFYVS